MSVILLVVSASFAFIAAAWLHELTHAVVARALGADVLEVNLIDLYVDFRFSEPAPKRERLVLLAPAIVGILSGAVALIVFSPSLDVLSAVATICWVIYTLNGGTHGELSITATKPAQS